MSANNGKKKGKTIAGRFEDIRADYDMSRASRFVRRRLGTAPQGGTADYHYRSEAKYYQDIEQARDMDRNDAIVGQTVDRAVANIVQNGFSLDVKTGDKKLDKDLYQRWMSWAASPDTCDISGEFTFHDMEQRVMRASLLDGDIAALGLDSGELQLIEAHAIQTNTTIPNTFLGVTLNEFRKREQFWIMKDSTTPNQTKETAEPVNVRDEDGNRVLFHVYNPKRVTQTRGVTAFAPIFALSGMFEDINFAKMVQQQAVSCFTIIRKQAMQAGGDEPPSVGSYGAATTETTAAGTRYMEGIGPGMEIVSLPGEDIQGFSPNIPNAEFFTHIRLMIQLIGANLGLPLIMVLMDSSEGSFSTWRGAIDEARKGFRSNQINLVKRFHCPVYHWKLRQWIKEDPALRSIKSSLNVFGHQWNPPTWNYIEPVKDAQGDTLRLQSALTSPRRLHGERSQVWDEISSEIVEDNAAAIIKAKKQAAAINKKYNDGNPVGWRDLMPLPMPSGVQMSMQDPNVVEQMDNEPEPNESE